MSLPAGFRDCLAHVLGKLADGLPADGDLVGLRQWLATRNLGLVPIAEPQAFAWPGQWLAVRGDDGDLRAVVMFGVPSGIVLDPAQGAALPIVEAFLVAPLDLHLDRERPYGGGAVRGTVAAVLVAAEREAALVRVAEARALAGRGLAGDRYCDDDGTFRKAGAGYDVTLVEQEVLDAVSLEPEAARRNVVTRGVDLNALVGRRFRIGEVECLGQRLAEPCAHLERLTRPGALRALVHRAGLRADVLTDGTIRAGDEIAAD